MTESVQTAPKMLVDAIAALNGHSAVLNNTYGVWRTEAFRQRAISNLTGRLVNDPNVQNADHTEVGQGLIKYFNLKWSNPQYWRYINGIRATFIIVLENLKQPYKLQLNDKLEDRGRVRNIPRRESRLDVGPLRQRFGFQDEWDHEPYIPLIQRDIEISTASVRDAPSAREVARTIVHEASHKWAFTTDVLYKHWGFAGTDPVNPDRKSLSRERAPVSGEDCNSGAGQVLVADDGVRKRPSE